MPPVVTYDRSEGVYAIRLREGAVARTIEVSDVHIVDVDDEGRVLTIEILDPRSANLHAVAERFGLQDELATIEEAVRAAVPMEALATAATSGTVWVPMHVAAAALVPKGGTPSDPGTALPPPREISLA